MPLDPKDLLNQIDKALNRGLWLGAQASDDLDAIWDNNNRVSEPYYWSALVSIAEDARDYLDNY